MSTDSCSILCAQKREFEWLQFILPRLISRSTSITALPWSVMRWNPYQKLCHCTRQRAAAIIACAKRQAKCRLGMMFGMIEKLGRLKLPCTHSPHVCHGHRQCKCKDEPRGHSAVAQFKESAFLFTCLNILYVLVASAM
jgi:hypothetical protein